MGYTIDRMKEINLHDRLDHIKALCELEWNGQITINEFRRRVNDIIADLVEEKIL